MGQKKRATAMEITFPFDREKAIQTVLWFSRHRKIDKLKLLKILFFADREHLIQYGRPIVGGKYCAMALGPVHSEVFDLIKEAEKKKVKEFSVTDNNIQAKGNAVYDEQHFSESDLDILEKIEQKYGKKDQFALIPITHRLKAWADNAPNPGSKKSNPMPYEDFFKDYRSQKSKNMRELIDDQQEIFHLLNS